MNKDIEFGISIDTNEAVEDVNKVDNAFNKLDSKFKDIKSSMARNLSFTDFKNGATAAIDITMKIGGALSDMIGKGLAAETSMKRFSFALSNAGMKDRISEMISLSKELSTLGQISISESQNIISSMLGMGLSKESLSKASKDSAIIASVTGKPLEDIAKKTAEYYSGNANALDEIFVATKNIKDENLKRLAVDKLISDTYKQQNELLNTSELKVKAFKLAWDEFLTNTAGKLIDWAKAYYGFVENIGRKIGGIESPFKDNSASKNIDKFATPVLPSAKELKRMKSESDDRLAGNWWTIRSMDLPRFSKGNNLGLEELAFIKKENAITLAKIKADLDRYNKANFIAKFAASLTSDVSIEVDSSKKIKELEDNAKLFAETEAKIAKRAITDKLNAKKDAADKKAAADKIIADIAIAKAKDNAAKLAIKENKAYNKAVGDILSKNPNKANKSLDPFALRLLGGTVLYNEMNGYQDPRITVGEFNKDGNANAKAEEMSYAADEAFQRIKSSFDNSIGNAMTNLVMNWKSTTEVMNQIWNDLVNSMVGEITDKLSKNLTSTLFDILGKIIPGAGFITEFFNAAPISGGGSGIGNRLDGIERAVKNMDKNNMIVTQKYQSVFNAQVLSNQQLYRNTQDGKLRLQAVT